MPPAFGRDVAAERRAVLARTHRIHKTQRRERGVELIEADAGLNDRDVVLGVDLDDRVHALEREDDAVGPRDARARQSRTGTARGDRNPELVTDAHHGGHLRGRAGQHNRERSHGSGRQRLVVRVVVSDGVAEQHVLRRQHLQRAALPDQPSGLCRRRVPAGQARGAGRPSRPGLRSRRRIATVTWREDGGTPMYPNTRGRTRPMSGDTSTCPMRRPIRSSTRCCARAAPSSAITARSLSSVNEDVTLPQFRSLVVLATAGPQTVSALADRLAVHASTMTRMCNRLVTRGLVVRAPSASRSPRSGYRADDHGYISGGKRDGRAARASSTTSCGAWATTTGVAVVVALDKFAQAAGEATCSDES